MRILAILLFWLTLLCLPAHAETVHAIYPAHFVACVDGDTCRFTVPIWPGLSAEPNVRLRGVDTPEMNGKCAGEKLLAVQARDWLVNRLASARGITLRDLELDLYGRVLATVTADGADIATMLVEAGLGRPYNGGKRAGWCE